MIDGSIASGIWWNVSSIKSSISAASFPDMRNSIHLISVFCTLSVHWYGYDRMSTEPSFCFDSLRGCESRHRGSRRHRPSAQRLLSFVGDCHINLENVGVSVPLCLRAAPRRPQIEGSISQATYNVAPTFCNFSQRTTHNHFEAIALLHRRFCLARTIRNKRQ